MGRDSTLTYRQEREKLKYSKFSSSLMLFQSTVGIGLFTLHKPMLHVGVFWAFFLNILVGFITTYGLCLLDEVSTKLEEDNPNSERVRGIKGKNCALERFLR
jgi:amino acid permease